MTRGSSPSAGPANTNVLGSSASPYLRQHADNPVHWQVWGEDALARAKRENRPILLSVGYSACHWCHVMAHESFEDEATAALMNAHFINIKVDREERPDVDAVYQKVVQMMGQGGGWPLTVFLTPEQKPFYGGTYFPKTPGHGRPSFTQLLEALAELFEQNPDKVDEQVDAFMDGYRSMATIVDDTATRSGIEAPLDPTEAIERGARALIERIDPAWGGLGREPKFPNPTALELLARVARWDAPIAKGATDALRLTLDKMYQGGIYDHLRGGFARYGVDRRWRVPHFEKMLYDNAQLLPLYAEAAARWPEVGHYRRVTEQTVDYLVDEMRTADGRFFSATDADSEGVEGKYFAWTPRDIETALEDPELAALFCQVYGVTEDGNFDHGWSVLHLEQTLAERAIGLELQPAELEARLEPALAALLRARAKRTPPQRDEKVVTGWNALLVSGLVRAGEALASVDPTRAENWLRLAQECADALWAKHVDRGADGSIARVLRSGFEGTVHLRGVLDDVAFFARACLDLHEATLERRWHDRAQLLLNYAIEEHLNGRRDGFNLAARGADALIDATESQHDGPIPAGVSVMLEVLARLDAGATEVTQLSELGANLLFRFRAAGEQPMGFASFLVAAQQLGPYARHVTLEGSSAEALPFASVVRSRRATLPHLVTMTRLDGDVPRAIVCRDRVCSVPLEEPSALSDTLGTS